MYEDSLVAADFPNFKNNQSSAYNQGWEVGFTTAWDPSRGAFDDDALAKAQQEVSEHVALLERLEAEGRKCYPGSTELTLDFVSHRADYDYWRGLVDGFLDDRHYTTRHRPELVAHPPREG